MAASNSFNSSVLPEPVRPAMTNSGVVAQNSSIAPKTRSAKHLVAAGDTRRCRRLSRATIAVRPASAIRRASNTTALRDSRRRSRATHRCARFSHGARHQFLAECDCRLLAALFVARADGGAFGIGQQRQIDGARKCAECKLRRAHADRSAEHLRGALAGDRRRSARPSGHGIYDGLAALEGIEVRLQHLDHVGLFLFLAASTACCCNATARVKLPLAAYAAAHVSR